MKGKTAIASRVQRTCATLLAALLAIGLSTAFAPAQQAMAATEGTVTVTPAAVATDTASVTVTVADADKLAGDGAVINIGTADASYTFESWTDTDEATIIAHQDFTGNGDYKFDIPSGKLAAGKKFVAWVRYYDGDADIIHVIVSTPVVIVEATPTTPTPDDILKACSVEIVHDGNFKEDEKSAEVKVKLHSSLEQVHLTVYAYPTNSSFDPDSVANKRLWAGFVRDGDDEVVDFAESQLPLKPGWSVIASLNVPVGEDWYKPSNSQAIPVVDENGQGVKPYENPEAKITDTDLEDGDTSVHVTLTGDERMFEYAKQGKIDINMSVGMYPDGEDFDFEGEDYVSLSNNFKITEPFADKEFTLKEPLKAGYRVRAVAYWSQNVDLLIPKGNDYEFGEPDDSVLVKGSSVVNPQVITLGAAYDDSKNVGVGLSGTIAENSSVIVKSYPQDATSFDFAVGTETGTYAIKDVKKTSAVVDVTAAPAEGAQLVAFIVDANGAAVAQSDPVKVQKSAATTDDAIAVSPVNITADATGFTVAVSGNGKFEGGHLIAVQANRSGDENGDRLGSRDFTGAGTYAFPLEKGELTAGKHLVVYLYKYDVENDATSYSYADDIVIAGSGSADPTPTEASAAIAGTPTAGDQALAVKLAGDIPADSLVLVKSYGADATSFPTNGGTALGTLQNAQAGDLTVNLSQALEANTQVVAFVLNAGSLVAASPAVAVEGEAPVQAPTIQLTDAKITAGMTRTKAAYDFDSEQKPATITLYMFDGDKLDTATATQISQRNDYYYPSTNGTLSLGQKKIVPGKKLQAVIEVGGQTGYSNIVEVQPSPNWGTPTIAIDALSIGADATEIPLKVNYADEYLDMDDFYCNITVYAYPARYSDADFEEQELNEKPNIARVVAFANNNSFGSSDVTRGEFSLQISPKAELKEGERLIAKLRLPHPEWEGEEQDFYGQSLAVTEHTVPIPAAIAGAILAQDKFTYNGKAKTPAVTVTDATGAVVDAQNYTIAYENNVNAGKGTATVSFTGQYAGTPAKALDFTIAKAKSTMTAKGKTVSVKAKDVKKKAKKVSAKKAFKVSKAQGKVTYKKASGNKKISVSKSGKVTVKKGLKKGTYKVKVKVTAAGNGNYKKATKTVTLKIKVK